MRFWNGNKFLETNSSMMSNTKASNFSSSKFSLWAGWILLWPLFLWTVGIFHAVDAGRILAIVFTLIFLVKRWRPHWMAPLELSPMQQKLCLLYLILYPLLIALQHFVRFYNGGQGVDGTAFIQIIQRFAEGEGLSSTLADTQAVYYLRHHFSPILYVPAVLSLLPIPAHISFILFGCITTGLILFIFYHLLKSLNYTKTVALLGTVLLAANYNLRHTFEWSYRPETFVYPFLVLSMYFWVKTRHWLAALSLLLSCMGKETLFPYAILFCCMAGVRFYQEYQGREKIGFPSILPYLIVLAITLPAFFIYFFAREPFLGLTHEYAYNRPVELIASAKQLLIPEFWTERFKWLLMLFLPLLGFPLYFVRGWLYLLPALSAVGIVLVSAYKAPQSFTVPLVHYTAIPTIVLFLATAYSLSKWKPLWTKKFPAGLAVLLVSLAYSFGGWKPLKTVYKYFHHQERLDITPIENLPKNSKILISSHGANLFALIPGRYHLLHAYLLRPEYKSFSSTIKDIDYLVLSRRDFLTDFPREITEKVELCRENPQIRVYCFKKASPEPIQKQ